MHADVINHIIKNKDQLVSVLHDSKFEQTVSLAKSRWTTYDPTRIDSEIVGIDSSYNSARYQGLEFWLSTGSATNVSQSTSLDLFKYGLERSRERAAHIASDLEMDLLANGPIMHVAEKLYQIGKYIFHIIMNSRTDFCVC